MGRSSGKKKISKTDVRSRNILLGEVQGSFRGSIKKHPGPKWLTKETEWMKDHLDSSFWSPELKQSFINMNINLPLYKVLYRDDGLDNYPLESDLFEDIDPEILIALETRPLTHQEKVDLLAKMKTNFSGYFPPNNDPILNAVFRNEVMRMRLEAQEFEKISNGEKHWFKSYEANQYNLETLKRAWVEKIIPSWSTGYQIEGQPEWWENEDRAHDFLAAGTTSILIAAMENEHSFDRLTYDDLTDQLKTWRENDPESLKDHLKEVIVPNIHYLQSHRSLWFGERTTDPTEEFLNELERCLKLVD
jgi:hypothetical protein